MTRHHRPGLLSPSRLEPVPIELSRVFWAGIALWALAAAVTAVLARAGYVPGHVVAVCATGIVLGFVGLAWDRRRSGSA